MEYVKYIILAYVFLERPGTLAGKKNGDDAADRNKSKTFTRNCRLTTKTCLS
jgi:hypothetical protein